MKGCDPSKSMLLHMQSDPVLSPNFAQLYPEDKEHQKLSWFREKTKSTKNYDGRAGYYWLFATATTPPHPCKYE